MCPQRLAQARAHGMREGAKEALRQVQQRFAPLTTDEERRRWGLTYTQCLPTYHSVLATAT